MENRDITSLINQVIVHKKYGPCLVIEVVSANEGKFVARLEQTGEVKKFILNPNFFENVEGYVVKEIKAPKTNDRSRHYKKVDLDKYRKHPLIQEIDKREKKIKSPSIDDEL